MEKTTKKKGAASSSKKAAQKKKTAKTSKTAKPSLSLAQRTFLQAYASFCGNITAACQKINISRQTFYDWKKNAAFVAELETLEVDERLVEIAEYGLLQRLKAHDMKAIAYVLDSKGASRGWGRNATLNVATKTPIVIQSVDVGFFDSLNGDAEDEN
ncbi:MAG: helix-turn-helix domain-containing protein [Thermoguttaceae bacterium]|nr:helix-turn-helix domain-containing protein [Thermoguttaceae bacterium]